MLSPRSRHCRRCDVQTIERAQRLEVVRRLAEDLVVDRDRLVGRVEHLLVDRAER